MSTSKKQVWRNAEGKTISKGIEPVDTKRCQTFPNQLNYSFMSFGPRPTPIRCDKLAVVVVVENKPAPKDKKIGAQSMCADCLVLYLKHFGQQHGQINRIGA